MDVARALAIGGMAFIHLAMGLSFQTLNSSWLGTLTECLDGRPATIFMILAGIGISLRVQGEPTNERVTHAAATLRKRGLFFLVVGYLNLIWWQGDILRVYGIGYLLMTTLLVAPRSSLWQAAAAIVVGFLVMMTALDYEQNWNWETLHYHNLWTWSGGARELLFNGFRSVFPWLAFMVVGMLIGRSDLGSPRVLARLAALGLGCWISAELISTGLLSYLRANVSEMDEETVVAMVGTQSMPPLPLFLLSSGGLAVTVICTCVFVVDCWQWERLFTPLVAAGQMAFTWYMAHIAICLALESATGGTVGPGTSLAAALGFFSAMLLVSYFYKRSFKQGPLEALLRWA